MGTRSANVIARVEPDIKTKAEAILGGLGIPVSTLINALYRQIIFNKGIPFKMTMPENIKTLDTISPEEFNEMMEEGIKQAENGDVVPLEEALAEIEEELKWKDLRCF